MTEARRERAIAAAAELPKAIGALHYEHLVQINDPSDPRVKALRRDQLWRGLVMRAEFPTSFVPWLDECSIQRDGGDLLRTLRYGQLIVHDRVRFDGEDAVDYEVLAEPDSIDALQAPHMAVALHSLRSQVLRAQDAQEQPTFR